MKLRAVLPDDLDLRKLQHGIKWTVYTLLLINFGYYIAEDWNRALHTLGPEAGWLDRAGAFATSIDEAGAPSRTTTHVVSASTASLPEVRVNSGSPPRRPHGTRS